MDQSPRTSTALLMRYGSGQLGAQIFRDTPAVLLPLFMTTMLGVPAWMAGLAVLLPKAWVLFCDPLVGAWSDRTSRTTGRGPFLLFGGLGTSIGFGALFLLTAFPSPLIAAASLCLIYLVAATAFSCFSVPYLALPSGMTQEPHERTRIFAYRMGFTVAGVIVGVGVAQPLVFHFGGGALGWHVMAAVLAAICLISMLVSATGRYSQPPVQTSAAPPQRLLDQFKIAAANKPFCILLLTSFLQSLSQACSYTVIPFFYLYVIGNVNMILPFVLCMSTGSLLAQPIWLALSRRFGKARAFLAACLIFIAITVTWVFAHPGTDVLVTLPLLGRLSTQEALVLVRAFLIGLTNAGFILLTLSILTDTIALSRRTGGPSNEGVFSGLFSAFEKLAFAVGPTIAGVILSACGFIASTGGVTAQSSRVIMGVLMLYSLIPAAIIALSLLVFTRYGSAVRRTTAVFLQPSTALSR